MALLLRKRLTKAHDVTGEARLPRGTTGGGRWTKGGASAAPPAPDRPPLDELRENPQSGDTFAMGREVYLGSAQGGAFDGRKGSRWEVVGAEFNTVWVQKGRTKRGLDRSYHWNMLLRDAEFVDPASIALVERQGKPALSAEVQRLRDDPQKGDTFTLDTILRGVGWNSRPGTQWMVRGPRDEYGQTPIATSRTGKVTLVPRPTWEGVFDMYGDKIAVVPRQTGIPTGPAPLPEPDPADIPHFEDADMLARATDSARRAAALAVGTFDDAMKWKKVGGTGKSKPYKAKLDDRVVLVAPDANARTGVVRKGIPPGTEAQRSEAVCLINRAMGCPVEMPEAIARQTPKGRALVQEFIGDAAGTVMDVGWDYLRGRNGKHFPSNEALNMAVLDGVAANLDRHWNNALIRPDRAQPSMDGEGGPHFLVAIDHGLSLPVPVPGYLKPSCNLLMQAYIREQYLGMDTDQWDALSALRENRDWLTPKLEALGIEPEAIGEMWKRADYMTDNGEIISDRDMESRPWGDE